MWPFKKRKRSSIEEFSKDSFDSAMRFEKAVGLEDNLKYTPMDNSMTIDQILREAFKRIHDEHRVALRHVYFDTMDVSTTVGGAAVCRSVQIEADTLRGEPYNSDCFRPMKPLIDQLADDLKKGGKFAREFEALYGLRKR